MRASSLRTWRAAATRSEPLCCWISGAPPARLAAEAGAALPLGHAVFDDRHVAQADRAPLALGHDDLAELRDALRLALRGDGPFALGALDAAARQLGVLAAQGVGGALAPA